MARLAAVTLPLRLSIATDCAIAFAVVAAARIATTVFAAITSFCVVLMFSSAESKRWRCASVNAFAPSKFWLIKLMAVACTVAFAFKFAIETLAAAMLARSFACSPDAPAGSSVFKSIRSKPTVACRAEIAVFAAVTSFA